MDIAKKLFIDYTQKNNGVISDYFINYCSNDKKSQIYGLKELKMVADTWRDKNDKRHVGWIYDRKNSLNDIKGKFMETIISNLYVLNILSGGNKYNLQTRINLSSYYEEINLLYKICLVSGIDINYLLFTSNENDKARNTIKNRFATLTKDPLFWDKLEKQLDYLIMNKNRLELRNLYLNNIYIMLKKTVISSYVCGFIDENDYSTHLGILENSANLIRRK